MIEDHSNLEEYRSTVASFQSIRKAILKKHDFGLLSEFRMILQKKI